MSTRPTGYSVLSYGQMITCEPRMSRYAEALRRAVTPGCTVIDIGAGPGLFAMLACKYGAGNVIAIEPNDSIELVTHFARANGFADRVTVFKGLSTDYSPPRKADVIVSDIRGILPLFEGHIATIADARKRLLAPGGKLIPSRDILRAAIAHSPENYLGHEEPWLCNKFELELSAAHRFAANSFSKVNLKAADLLSDAIDLAVLDYGQIEDPNVVAGFELVATKSRTAHGLLVWFDAELAEAIGFSNAPGEPELVYGQTLFPFERAVDLDPGDRVTGEIGARLIDGQYVWTWRSAFRRASSPDPLEFRQSTFLSSVLPADKLRSRASNFAPPPRPMHEVDRYCLAQFDGKRTVEEIAGTAMEKYATAFRTPTAALDHVARLAASYEDERNRAGR